MHALSILKRLALIFSLSLIATHAAANSVISIAADENSIVTISSGKESRSIRVQPGDRFSVVVVSGKGGIRGASNVQKECQTAFGTTACGYNCEAAFGKVVCADHPDQKCVASFGDIKCGYDCIAAFGKIRCANTPEGKCYQKFGDITCVD